MSEARQPPPDLRRDPAARRVMKRPVTLHVAFATTDGTCETLEGPVRYRAGDAIVTGTRGEQWPIERARFETAYEPSASGEPDAGAGSAGESNTSDGNAGWYKKRPLVALARRVDVPLAVPVGWQNDPLDAQPGDWLLQYGEGDYGVVDADVFEQTYDLL
ncbi:MAG: PGDYG domain-containing protein [Janthinobacterium lividum]